MKPLTLYTTPGCHLCEHAEAILDAAQCSFTGVDIAEDLTLLERYGVRIPVVKDATGRELGWPFDTAQLKAFLAAY
ncbi:MAG: thioredoxin family protein [Halieaceae bacterium]|jgi:glutaredoxin|nr:thioredoxin family protein [Halieaceae bacterium]|tara:strand:+ start:13908 stop:14135 length:228 start_codon:yes stop_codon:yes gene_type:complete